jgi:transposase
MTKRERALKMFEMRLDGLSYEEIGKKVGLSRQRVHQIICVSETKRTSNLDYVIYPGLKKWMKENSINATALQRMMYQTSNTCRAKQKLSGEVKFNIHDIKKIIKVSGLTFEELFLTNEEQGGE